LGLNLKICTPSKGTGSTLTRNQVDRRIFASSIDLNIKLQRVAFVQFPHPRTFNSTDVHKSVRLAIITRDKAEALHCVEEFHRASSLVAGQLTLGSAACSATRRSARLALGNSDHIADDHEIAGRHFAATIHKRELEALTFSQAFQTSAVERADVHEHIFAAVFTLDEAEALLTVEEFHNALALANDLSRHAATGAATVTTAEAAAARCAAAKAAAAWSAATSKAATIAAAEAAAIAAAKATATAATAEAITATAAKTVTTTACERIEAIFAKTVALVSAPAATPSIKTHKPERTFASPRTTSSGRVDESRQTTGQMTMHHARPFPL